jgi:hypothetical protein
MESKLALYKNCDARDKSPKEISAEMNIKVFGRREVAQKKKIRI